MLNSRIAFPTESPIHDTERWHALRRLVEGADEMLREETAKLEGHTVWAVWQPSPVEPASRVELELRLGPEHIVRQILDNELSDRTRLRQILRDALWDVVTAYALYNQWEILRLAAEIKQERATAGK
jgi:hypothetical protein